MTIRRFLALAVASLLLGGVGSAAATRPPDLIAYRNTGQVRQLACDFQGNLWAALYWSGARMSYTLGPFVTYGAQSAPPCGTGSLVPVGDGTAFLATTAGGDPCGWDSIFRVTDAGGNLASFCAASYDPEAHCGTRTLAYDPRGYLYSIDQPDANYDPIIRKWNLDYELLAEWNLDSWVTTYLWQMVVDSQGRILATDTRGYRVLVISDQGEVLETWSQGAGRSFGVLGGISLTHEGQVLVTDTSGWIHILEPDGTPIDSWWDSRISGHAVAMDELGYVYASAADGILKFDNKPGVELPPPLPPHDSAIFLHVGAPVTRAPCDSLVTAHWEIETHGTTGGDDLYTVYVVLSPATVQSDAGIRGAQFGIRYDDGPGGIDLYDWSACSQLSFPMPEWPASETGITVTWANTFCQRRELTVAAYFQVDPGTGGSLQITGYPVTGLAKTADCAGAESNLGASRLGWVGFDPLNATVSLAGCNPLHADCSAPVPVERTTWGRIKMQFRDR